MHHVGLCNFRIGAIVCTMVVHMNPIVGNPNRSLSCRRESCFASSGKTGILKMTGRWSERTDCYPMLY
ncbi:hypothetical protein DPMN_135455 [Dreissena polymorpha]|uniref:Uncharacterized protein n=1 Tax=Dreissena polymorpha TaxID=45954 RepID=A0A9D4G3Y6_DREPO|nr:hypothetical protein DPMN_135455 [Dreissena polymorpha]